MAEDTNLALGLSELYSPLSAGEEAMPHANGAAGSNESSHSNGRSQSGNVQSLDDGGAFDVVDLEERYLKRMEELAQVEQKIFEDFASWQRVCYVFPTMKRSLTGR